MKNKKLNKITSIFVILFFLIQGCTDGLKVNNPNNLLESDIENFVGATGIANGANGTVLQGIGYVYAPYEVATDEVYWIGSRNAWDELDKGNISDPNNEFVDQAWPYITEGRWMSDKAISQLETFRKAGTLINKGDLARSYIYGALVRIVIGETFDNFVYSNKTENGFPIGKNNMGKVFDEAVVLLDSAISISAGLTASVRDDYYKRSYGFKARAKHSKAVWESINNPEGTIKNEFVDVGSAEATQALAVMGTSDFKYKPDYKSVTLFNELAWEIVGRSELKIHVAPTDPITKIRDARWVADSADFVNKTAYSDRYSPMTFISSREMHLIIAESQIKNSNFPGAITSLNKIRAFTSGMTAIPTAMPNDSVKIMLKHERRVNTLLQGRRLNDMYRWGIKDTKWLSNNASYTSSGRLLPITIRERKANLNVTDND